MGPFIFFVREGQHAFGGILRVAMQVFMSEVSAAARRVTAPRVEGKPVSMGESNIFGFSTHSSISSSKFKGYCGPPILCLGAFLSGVQPLLTVTNFSNISAGYHLARWMSPTSEYKRMI